jgi:AraC family transcriptional regulator
MILIHPRPILPPIDKGLKEGGGMDGTAIRDLDDWVTRFANQQERMRARLANPPARRVRDGAAASAPLSWRDLGFEQVRLGLEQDVMTPQQGRHVAVVLLGSGRIRFGAKREAREVRPGSVVFLPAGSGGLLRADAPVDACIVGLERRLAERVARQAFGGGRFRLEPAFRDYDFGMIGLAGVLAEEAGRSVRGNNLYVNSLANLLATHLLRHYAKWPQGLPEGEGHSAFERTLNAPEPVRRAIVHIRENHTRELGAQEIADAAGANPFVLKRLFWESLGTEPVQYVLQLRMQSAEALLAAGARSLPEIAQAVGFGDPRALQARR